MPLFSENTFQNTRYAIWQIAEDEAFFLANLPIDFLEKNNEYAAISHPKSKQQWLASRFLWYKLWQENVHENLPFLIEKNEFGKPYLQNSRYEFSLSHSDNFVAVMMAKTPCGIDIQTPNPKIDRLAHRFMHPSDWQELENHNLETTLFWSAKEAIFKAWTVGGLAGKNIRLANFSQTQTAEGLVVLNEELKTKYQVFYQKKPLFTLSIALGEGILSN